MTARPRFKTEVPPGPTWSRDLVSEMTELGYDPMPWQVEAADIIGALRDDGRPRFKTVIATVPRQSGKTSIAKAFLSAAAKRRPGQRLYVTAQTRMDALRHLEALALSLGDAVKHRLSVGSERITWPNLTTLEVVAPTPGGGHGLTIDRMLLDEVWELEPYVLAAVVPATVANPDSQLLFISTMGTVESEVWNGLVARGRESVEDPESDVGYLEYSAESDADVFDEAKWSGFMPALGYTQTVESVRTAMAALSPNEAIRAFGNRVTTVVNSVFPAEWLEQSWQTIQPPQRFALAVDVNDSPPGASLVTGHLTEDGKVATRHVEHRYGSPRWVPTVVEEMLTRREVEAIVLDAGGPASAIVTDIEVLAERFGVPLIKRTPRDFGADCLAMYDALREEDLVQVKTETLSAAFDGSHKKTLQSDVWLIARRLMTVDASPLIATILAFGVARELSIRPVIKPFIL